MSLHETASIETQESMSGSPCSSISSFVYEPPTKPLERKISKTQEKKEREKSRNNRSMSRLRTAIKSVYAQCKPSSKDSDFLHIFIILGATTEIATRKMYPSLWNLYKNNLLPQKIRFFGFAKSPITADELRCKCKSYMRVEHGEHNKFEEFWKLHSYSIGSYLARSDFDSFTKEFNNLGNINHYLNRLFYIALPNSTIEHISQYIKIMTNVGSVSKGWMRAIIEKPYGHDTESSDKLTQILLSLFREEEIYRIDHFLGREIMQNLITLRFANSLLSMSWNRNFIESVLITIKEPHGVRFKSKYFDNYGIIRDVMQNHMLQILSLIAMEKPLSTRSEDVREEKIKVLKHVRPVKFEDVVLGQYIGKTKPFEGEEGKNGYTDEPDIPKNSLTPTFCAAVVKINNERWEGVPFILVCGKAMNEKLSQIRIQYRDLPGDIFDGKSKRNELVIQIDPQEGVSLKAVTKIPSHALDVEEMELQLNTNSFHSRTHQVFDRLLLDVFCGSQMHFVSSEELAQAWRVFTPILHKIENDRVHPVLYCHGSRGPREADDLIRKNKFVMYD